MANLIRTLDSHLESRGFRAIAQGEFDGSKTMDWSWFYAYPPQTDVNDLLGSVRSFALERPQRGVDVKVYVNPVAQSLGLGAMGRLHVPRNAILLVMYQAHDEPAMLAAIKRKHLQVPHKWTGQLQVEGGRPATIAPYDTSGIDSLFDEYGDASASAAMYAHRYAMYHPRMEYTTGPIFGADSHVLKSGSSGKIHRLATAVAKQMGGRAIDLGGLARFTWGIPKGTFIGSMSDARDKAIGEAMRLGLSPFIVKVVVLPDLGKTLVLTDDEHSFESHMVQHKIPYAEEHWGDIVSGGSSMAPAYGRQLGGAPQRTRIQVENDIRKIVSPYLSLMQTVRLTGLMLQRDKYVRAGTEDSDSKALEIEQKIDEELREHVPLDFEPQLRVLADERGAVVRGGDEFGAWIGDLLGISGERMVGGMPSSDLSAAGEIFREMRGGVELGIHVLATEGEDALVDQARMHETGSKIHGAVLADAVVMGYTDSDLNDLVTDVFDPIIDSLLGGAITSYELTQTMDTIKAALPYTHQVLQGDSRLREPLVELSRELLVRKSDRPVEFPQLTFGPGTVTGYSGIPNAMDVMLYRNYHYPGF